jgi:hypothetical protein
MFINHLNFNSNFIWIICISNLNVEFEFFPQNWQFNNGHAEIHRTHSDAPSYTSEREKLRSFCVLTSLRENFLDFLMHECNAHIRISSLFSP